MAEAERIRDDEVGRELVGASGSAGNGNGAVVRLVRVGGIVESELGSVQAELIDYLRARFRGTLDHDDVEDIAQGAWETLLRKQRAGEEISDPVGYIRTIAWRDARDLVRDRREASTDPADVLFGEIEDREASVEERLERRIELAHAIEAVEQLSAEHRAAYRARFFEDLSTEEACERLGLARSTYRHRLRRAVDTVSANLDGTRFARLQRTLLGAYIAGVASAPERRRAELLIRTDPRAAATARELRAAHESTAAALAPIAIEPDAATGIAERVMSLPSKLRESLPGGGHGTELSEAAGSASNLAAGARGSGAAAGGVLAKLTGLGGAGKIAAACLGASAAATACVAAGIVPGVAPGLAGKGDREPKAAARVSQAVQTTPAAPLEEVKPIAQPDPTPQPAPPQAETKPEPAQEPVTEEPPREQTAAPSAPASEQEFGVVAATASTPTGGSRRSGGGSGGGSGGSALQREFGP